MIHDCQLRDESKKQLSLQTKKAHDKRNVDIDVFSSGNIYFFQSSPTLFRYVPQNLPYLNRVGSYFHPT